MNSSIDKRPSQSADEKDARNLQNARARRTLLKVRAYRAAPWLLWVLCIIGAAYFGKGLTGLGVSPGVASANPVDVYSPKTAVIEKVLKKPGDLVKKGDVLVQLSTKETDLEIAIAVRELERIELEVGARAGSLKRTDLITKERLSSDAERAALEVAQVQSENVRDRAELQQLEEQIARQMKLVDERLARADTLDELKLRKASLAEKVREGETLLRRAREHRSASKARVQEFRNELTSAGQTNPEIAPFQAAALSQKERVAQLRSFRTDLSLKAPKDGVLAQVRGLEGGVAMQDALVLSVVDKSPTQVLAYVDEKRARRVRVGDRATLAPSDKASKSLKGSVRALAPTVSLIPQRFRVIPAEESFGRVVYIDIESDASDVLSGQAFDVTFARGGS